MDRVVSALLAELDSLEQHSVTVIGATNRPDLLDAALLRPGRFERSIYLGTTSSPEEQMGILRAQTRRLRLSAECDMVKLVSSLPPGLSGADLSSLVSGAALIAVRRQILMSAAGVQDSQLPEITTADFLTAAKEMKQSVSSSVIY